MQLYQYRHLDMMFASDGKGAVAMNPIALFTRSTIANMILSNDAWNNYSTGN